MNIDRVFEELYANKEALAAKYGSDLKSIAEAFRRSPSWQPVARPARKITTAEARFKRMMDGGDLMRELRQTKERIAAECGGDIRKLLGRFNSTAADRPSLPTSTSRPKNKSTGKSKSGAFRSQKNAAPKKEQS